MSASGDITVAVLGTRGFPSVQGGVETHCQQLYTRMVTCCFRVYRRKPFLSQLSFTHYDNIEFIDWPSTRIQGLEAAWHTLRAAWHCIWHRPSLIHVHNMGPALFALPAKLAGIPVVMTYHSINYEHPKWGMAAKWLLRLSECLSLRCCDRVIFVNRSRMERFKPSIRQKSVYVPNGIEPTTPTQETDFLKQHGIHPGEYVLTVGRISPEKGLEHLVNAANNSPSISQVVVAGDCDHGSNYRRELQKLDKAGKVVFTGYVSGEDLRQLYSHARMLALPSLSEGFPMTLLEAMAYRLPIVASDLEATRLVELPESSYCQAGDTESLQAAIEVELAQPTHHVDYDLSTFDWEEIAKRTLAIYKDALK